MPIAIQSTSHASPSPSRPVLQNLRDSNPRLSNLRDSKGLGFRHAVAANAATRAHSKEKSRFSRLPQEPEDARITGVTRSLTRRLLALNIMGTLRPALLAEPIDQVA